MSKFQQVMTKEVVDRQTGEIITTEVAKTYTVKADSDSFYMTFIEHAAPLFKIRSITTMRVLTYLCMNCMYETNKAYFPSKDRKEFSSKYDISQNNITNALRSLKKLNLISGEEGVFMINPQILWKGSTSTRSQLLKDSTLRITFSIE